MVHQLTSAKAKRINFLTTCDALTQPMMKGISCPVVSMVLTLRILFQRIVNSMLAMNHAMLRATQAFHREETIR